MLKFFRSKIAKYVMLPKDAPIKEAQHKPSTSCILALQDRNAKEKIKSSAPIDHHDPSIEARNSKTIPKDKWINK
jgi:hypothetical protein